MNTATEFSYMRTKTPVLLAALLAMGLIFAMPLQGAQAATTNLTIDLSTYGPDNLNDYTYAIDCSDPTYVYTTLFVQGRILQVDKSTKIVTDSFNDPKGAIVGGQSFYALTRDSDGRLYTADENYGLIWQFDPSTETWDSAPLFEEITGNANVTYPDGYSNDPTLIRVDEDTHGFHTYGTGLEAFATVKYIPSNDHVYSALGYAVDFDAEGEAAGATDLSFAGLAKVNPDTMAVTRIPITGADTLASIAIDSMDSSILWISDRGADKIFKFDVDTDTLVETINLTAGSTPLGMANDASSLYVALNKQTGDNSEILKISKADTSIQTVIDTGAPRSSFLSGTFSVFIANDLLLWTDQSQHIGTINLSTNAKSHNTTTFADSNHWGCEVNSEFWWAGEGSAIIGFTDIEDPPVPPAEEDEEDDDAPSGNRNPPSKQGKGLGIVFSCYYSHVNCEQIVTLEPAVIEWIKNSNAVENNPEVLSVLE